jgi:hypothetical protein
MILKNIFAKNIGKKWAFLTQNKAKLFKNLIITLVFEKSAICFAENWQKLAKIVILTSTPEHLCFELEIPCMYLKCKRNRFIDQGCQIFLGTKYQNGKKLPNYHELYQMSIKCNKRL